MPVNLDNIGIQSVDLTLAESVEVTRKLETKPLLDSHGRFADGKAFDPTMEFSLKGRGDLPAVQSLQGVAEQAIRRGAPPAAAERLIQSGLVGTHN